MLKTFSASAVTDFDRYNPRKSVEEEMMSKFIAGGYSEETLNELYEEYVYDTIDVWIIVKMLCDIGLYERAEELVECEGLSFADCCYPEIFFHCQPHYSFMINRISEIDRSLTVNGKTLVEFYVESRNCSLVQILLDNYFDCDPKIVSNTALRNNDKEMIHILNHYDLFVHPRLSEHPQLFLRALSYTNKQLTISYFTNIVKNNPGYSKDILTLADQVDFSKATKPELTELIMVNDLTVIEFLHSKGLFFVPDGAISTMMNVIAKDSSFSLFIYVYSRYQKCASSEKLLNSLYYCTDQNKLVHVINNVDFFHHTMAMNIVKRNYSGRSNRQNLSIARVILKNTDYNDELIHFYTVKKFWDGLELIAEKSSRIKKNNYSTHLVKCIGTLIRHKKVHIVKLFLKNVHREILYYDILKHGLRHIPFVYFPKIMLLVIEENLFEQSMCTLIPKINHSKIVSLSNEWVELFAKILLISDHNNIRGNLRTVLFSTQFIHRVAMLDNELMDNLLILYAQQYLPVLVDNNSIIARRVLTKYYNSVVTISNIIHYPSEVIFDYVNQCIANIETDTDKEYALELLSVLIDYDDYYQKLFNKLFCSYSGLQVGKDFGEDIKLDVRSLLLLARLVKVRT